MFSKSFYWALYIFIFVATSVVPCNEAKTLSRAKRGVAQQDIHNRAMSNKVHNDRVRVLKGKVDKLNSGEWENDDRVVLPKKRQRRRRHRHYQMERDGNGGFRRVKANPSESEGFKLEIEIGDPIAASSKNKKVSEVIRRKLFERCMELYEMIKLLELSVEYKCEF